MKTALNYSIFLVVMLTSACGGGGGSLTKADSLKIAVALDSSGEFKPVNYFRAGGMHFPTIQIPASTATAMMNAYASSPMLQNVAGHTPINYIKLDSSDWNALQVLNQTKPIKALYFEFGIQNYSQVTAGIQLPQFTIITMPQFVSTNATDLNYAYDFGCPCPGSPCCP